jgi:uncharacterized membrane protein
MDKRKIGRYIIISLMALIVYVISFFFMVVLGFAFDSRYKGFFGTFYAPIIRTIISNPENWQ